MNRLCNTHAAGTRDAPPRRRRPSRGWRRRYFGGSEPGAESSSGNEVAPDCAGATGVLVGSVTGDAVADDVPPLVRTPAVPCAIARSKRFAASAFVLT